MFAATRDLSTLPKPEFYAELASQLSGLTSDEPDAVANLANCAALIFHALPQLNWAGFYLLKEDELVLGPFQGKPACIRIPLGRGVCGTAAASRRVLRVRDVNEFPGHITCDAASRSEIVFPLISADGELLGVLDLDSPDVDRFDEEDERGLQRLATVIAAKL